MRPRRSRTSLLGLSTVAILLALAAVGFGLLPPNPSSQVEPDPVIAIDPAALVPDWTRISAWPGFEAPGGSNPDPGQLSTVIVLDDSGSMGPMMLDAKQAVIDAVSQFPDNSRVAVIALNRGRVLDAVAVDEARASLPAAIDPVMADGKTPLGRALGTALDLLAQEAARQRGFGTYRILIATDGRASDAAVLRRAIAEILSASPVEVATIGIGIGEGHALNMPGFTDYVSVQGVDRLAAALAQVSAEQESFQPVTAFEKVE